MKLNKINKKVFGLSLGLTFTSIVCSSCNMDRDDSNLISYDDLVNNYKVVELTSFDKKNIHIVKKEEIKDKPNCYGYYDIYHHECIIKVDEENGLIIGHGIINNIAEIDMKNYIEMYNINQDKFSNSDLDIMIDMIRNDYINEEKTLVK